MTKAIAEMSKRTINKCNRGRSAPHVNLANQTRHLSLCSQMPRRNCSSNWDDDQANLSSLSFSQVWYRVHTTIGCGKQGFPSAHPSLSHILNAVNSQRALYLAMASVSELGWEFRRLGWERVRTAWEGWEHPPQCVAFSQSVNGTK
jgi:hypothetical protein